MAAVETRPRNDSVENSHGLHDSDVLFPQKTFYNTFENNRHINRATQNSKWSYRQVLAAVLLCAMVMVQFMCESSIGPSLLDLAHQTHSEVHIITWILFAKATGTLITTLFIERYLPQTSRWFLFSLICCYCGGCFGYAPWDSHLWVQIVLFAIFGILGAYIRTLSTMSIQPLFSYYKDRKLWDDIATSCSIIGCVIGPLVVGAFFYEKDFVPKEHHQQQNFDYQHEPLNGHVKMGDINARQQIINSSEFISTRTFQQHHSGKSHKTEIMYGFVIEAVIVFYLGAVIFLVWHVTGGFPSYERSRDFSRSIARSVDNLDRNIERQDTWPECICIAIFIIVHSETSAVYGSFLVLFVVKYLHWSKQQGVYLTSIFFGVLFFSHAITLLSKQYLHVHVSIILVIVMSSISTVCLIFFIHTHWSIIVVCSAILAFSSGTIRALVLDHYLDSESAMFMQTKYQAVSFMIFAPLTGYLLRYISYEYFIYMTSGCCVFSFVVITLLFVISPSGRTTSSRLSDETSISESTRLLGH